MGEAQSNHRLAIVIAVIGLVGTIGAALLGNWDKIFRRAPVTGADTPNAQQPRETTASAPTTDPRPSSQPLVTPSSNSPSLQQPHGAGPPSPKPTTVLRSDQDRIIGYKLVSEGPGLAVFEVDYTYDPAHEGAMYVRVIVYSDAQPVKSVRKLSGKRIAVGISEPLTRDGKVRVDARKLLAEPTESDFIEVTLSEGSVPVTVSQFPFRRRWGPA